MDGALHRFVRLLRLHGIRIGISEVVDASRAAGAPGVLEDRELLRSALRVTLVKDQRDEAAFDRVFDRFFRLRAVVDSSDEHGHSHAHDDLEDDGELDEFVLSEEPGNTPSQGHSHGKPQDIRDFFDPEDLAQQYNLHQEANKLDMAAMTDEIVLSNDGAGSRANAARLQLDTSRLHNPGRPGKIADRPGTRLDSELTVAEEMALLAWLDEGDEAVEGSTVGTDELAALRTALSGLLEGLPDALQHHLEELLATEAAIESREAQAREIDRIGESERATLEESLRRLIHSLHGAPRSRRREAARGSIDGSRTMRRNLRSDGVPFRPVTVAKVTDRPRLLVLADVSLSVRAAARFTLQLVHGLQGMASHVRTFAFVSDLVEVTDLFAEHQMEEALSLTLSGLPAGGVLDVDTDSDYGSAFRQFLEEFGGGINRRTTVVVLGDGRGNGNDPGTSAFEEITRRARETIWITPEPRWSWGLGSCDLPAYAAHCDRVHVVRDLAGLDLVTSHLTEVPR
ncbi:VWA domain-containing protein [Nocardioides sp.]|uniref:VWA domain-containing protein n=1 Tax=Nocardioides sp. TaxID=35761 RepID=UPI002C2AB7DC|nr:VWA domain-containing protein [Nocardioides sp.]HSX67193.1 VWA domain-containing protein [Nocardioides sp.]